MSVWPISAPLRAVAPRKGCVGRNVSAIKNRQKPMVSRPVRGTAHDLKNRSMHVAYVDENTSQRIGPEAPKYQIDTLDCSLEELAVLEWIAENPVIR